jgi:hypothetical protein
MLEPATREEAPEVVEELAEAAAAEAPVLPVVAAPDDVPERDDAADPEAEEPATAAVAVVEADVETCEWEEEKGNQGQL